MANVLEYSKIFQPSLDKQVVQESTTGWMEANSNLVRYNGGNEVKLPNILMDGLADYDRSKGFVGGDVELVWNTHTLTQDRGPTFTIDSQDVDETNFVLTAGTVMGEFQRTQVVPEIDAYRYSKIATIAKENGRTREETITEETILDLLLKDLSELEDNIGAQQFVLTLNPILARQLAKVGKDYMGKGSLQKGEMSIDVQAFNEHGIVKASSKHLKTSFIFRDGTTSGQEAGGFTVDDGAQDINWIIATPDAPIAISKTDKVRTFSPDVNQNADAWKVDYRKYHDLWIPKNKLAKVFVNLKPVV